MANLYSLTYDEKGADGIIVRWDVNVGDLVAKNDSIVVIQRTCDNIEKKYRSAHAGIIQFLHSDGIGKIISDGEQIAQIEKRDHVENDVKPIVELITVLLKKRRESERKLDEVKSDEEREFHQNLLDEIDSKVFCKRKEMLDIYKKLVDSEKEKLSRFQYVPFTLTRAQVDEYCKYVPQLPLDPRATDPSLVKITFHTIHQQDSGDKTHSFLPYFYGHSTSTYPYIESKGGREGEPICDQYRVSFTPPTCIVTMADGCNWGVGPAEAALKSSKAFTKFIEKHKHSIRTTQRLARLCLQGLCAAHNSIIEGPHVEGKTVGTTTLLGGVVVKVILPGHEETPAEKLKDWVFLFACIGDCKAFLWVNKKKFIEELTPDSRGENFMDASDCGGRIGPYIEGGPDLRNLEVFMSPCVEGDLIFICSDGVHDNFDPQMQGVNPDELGLSYKEWKDADAASANAAKAEYRCTKMKELINPYLGGSTVDLKQITDVIIEYCKEMNLPSQQFMQENPGKRLPNDYTRFPGKMDHTTIIVLRVGEYHIEDFYRYSSSEAFQNIETDDSSHHTTTTSNHENHPDSDKSTSGEEASKGESPIRISIVDTENNTTSTHDTHNKHGKEHKSEHHHHHHHHHHNNNNNGNSENSSGNNSGGNLKRIEGAVDDIGVSPSNSSHNLSNDVALLLSIKGSAPCSLSSSPQTKKRRAPTSTLNKSQNDRDKPGERRRRKSEANAMNMKPLHGAIHVTPAINATTNTTADTTTTNATTIREDVRQYSRKIVEELKTLTFLANQFVTSGQIPAPAKLNCIILSVMSLTNNIKEIGYSLGFHTEVDSLINYISGLINYVKDTFEGTSPPPEKFLHRVDTQKRNIATCIKDLLKIMNYIKE